MFVNLQYYLGLAPSDYYFLFTVLKTSLGEKKFDSNDEIQSRYCNLHN